MLMGMMQPPAQLQLGAGVFLIGFDPDSATSLPELRALIARALDQEDKLLGLTTGRGLFRCIPQIRSLAEDARRPATEDSLVLDGWTVTLSGTLAEFSGKALTALMPFSAMQTTGSLTTLCAPMTAQGARGIEKLCWVGDSSAGLVLIELTHALNVPGASFSFLPEGEGSTPFEFRAHGHSAWQDAPFRILLFSSSDL